MHFRLSISSTMCKLEHQEIQITPTTLTFGTQKIENGIDQRKQYHHVFCRVNTADSRKQHNTCTERNTAYSNGMPSCSRIAMLQIFSSAFTHVQQSLKKLTIFSGILDVSTAYQDAISLPHAGCHNTTSADVTNKRPY